MNFKFTESVVKKAFVARRQAYPDWYADGQIAPTIKAWTLASSAFDPATPSRQDFNALYNELKGKWQVFRN